MALNTLLIGSRYGRDLENDIAKQDAQTFGVLSGIIASVTFAVAEYRSNPLLTAKKFGKLGAIAGAGFIGTISLFSNIFFYDRGERTVWEATGSTIGYSVGGGIATGFAAALAGSIGKRWDRHFVPFSTLLGLAIALGSGYLIAQILSEITS
ncbi:MAG: hypothetical protein HYT76_01005 [Deltaproteobacteria bacterium]|nr:hypothetical protein [Deltaproteobacteria bacterium]